MIHYVEGDILLSGAELVAQGVAPHDDFHHGLALALRERWPGMYKDFRHYCRQSNPDPGAAWVWGGPGHVRIANLLTQEPNESHHGQPGKAKTKHVGHALRALRGEIERRGFRSVALPKLATGVGGLDWAEVKPLIEQHLGDLDVEVYVYETYHAGQAATEPNLPTRA